MEKGEAPIDKQELWVSFESLKHVGYSELTLISLSCSHSQIWQYLICAVIRGEEHEFSFDRFGISVSSL